MFAFSNRSKLLVAVLSLSAVLPVAAEETATVEEVAVTASPIKAAFPASSHQRALVGEGELVEHEPDYKQVEGMLPITEHQYQSLEPKSKLLGLPISSTE
jgi:hypothetical protein